MRQYIERRIYYFTCSSCGHENRQTLKRRKAKQAICRKCKRNYVDPNQQSLFQFETQIKGKINDEPEKSKKNPTVISQKHDRAFAGVRQ